MIEVNLLNLIRTFLIDYCEEKYKFNDTWEILETILNGGIGLH